MLTAITRLPGPELARCELTHLARQPIDLGADSDGKRDYR